jgi:parallel beta-helix repeat protein
MGTAPDQSNPASPWPTNVTIRGNHVHDCWGEGIGIWFGAGVTIEDNVVERAFNVGIYFDNASNVTVARNFVSMTSGMAANGGTGRGILLGVEPYSFKPTVQSDHDITIENNVIVADGIGWWTSSSTSPNNTYANVKILQNTILSATGAGIGFSAVGTGAVSPSGCLATNNVVSESGASYVSDASAFAFSGNAWLNEKLPKVAGSTDVMQTITVPTVATASDAEPLAAMVGAGVASGVATDFLCQARSATAPTRGAFEH